VSAICKLTNSIWNKETLPEQRKESIILPVNKKGVKLAVIIIMGYHCYQLHTRFYQTSFSQALKVKFTHR
jgi:hypothetical protein